jgi:hypothetical protein
LTAPDKRDCCRDCGAALSGDDLGASKKFLGRGAGVHICIPCLAARLNVREGLLRQKIEDFRAAGCILFAPRR